MKTYERIGMRRVAWLAGASALALAAGLWLLLFQYRVLAADPPPTSQTRLPEKGALITQKDPLTIEGVAWESDNPPPFPGDPVLLPINNSGDPNYVVDWTDMVLATNYALYEATSPYFENEILRYGGPDTETFVLNQPNGTYHYRVKAYNASGDSRWSNVESAVVGTQFASAEAAPVEVAANGPITVWVKIDDGAWEDIDTMTPAAWGGWEWSYEWTPPPGTYVEHTIHTRASDADEDYGPIDTIGVTVRNESFIVYMPQIFKRWPPIPYAPTLHSIDNPYFDDTYTVSWSYDYSDPPVDTYTLQEATNANFTTNVTDYYPLSSTSYAFSDKDDGTYYYRVRGHNSYGPGAWSNVKSTTASAYYFLDDFSDYKSGWPREWSKTRGALYQVHPHEHPSCPGSDCQYDDGDGYVIARRSGSDPAARFSPEVVVPWADYEIELDARWWDANYFATYQIFFGSDSELSNYYALQVRLNTASDDDCEYSLVRHTSSLMGDNWILSTKTLQDWTESSHIKCGVRSDNSNASWDHWKIRRDGDQIKVYANGNKLGTWEDSKFGANRYFGVGCTLYEGFTPSKPEFDDWSVARLE